ncbi:leucine-rich repeat-containing protein 40-like [Centruroides vittatus]|uniref:leucine-rich repeat-containing protein 40-like n=1 Tax=Centruroides vittatus TaxID=120091 RepID=UPI003510247E
MWSVLYVVSSVLAVSSSLESSDLCPEDVDPCTCEGFLTFMYLSCSKFDNMGQVQRVLRTFPSPIAHLTIEHDSIGLTSDAFQDVCIRRLVLQLNQLSEIPDSLFLNQANCLYFLSITEGSLQEMPINALLPLHELATLSISNNRISEVKGSLRQLNLITLILNNNSLSHINSGTFPLSLKSLSLSDNHIEDLNGSLIHLTQLEWLILSNNNIKSLNDELANFNSLNMLLLGRNQLENLDNSLHNLSKLEILDLSENRITTLNHNFIGLDSLFKLNLSRNLLTQIHEDEFAPLIDLKILDLSRNQFNTLGNSLRLLKKLRILNLNGNRLVKIDASFDCLNVLKVLNLSHNMIQNLDFLNPNQTDHHPECQFRNQNSLKIMDISENPLECTPSVAPVVLGLKLKNAIIEGNPCH